MTAQCKWNNVLSDVFEVNSGVKQGGVLSPHFFAVYIDELIKILRSKNIGCHILKMFVACIFYADDLTLISPTRSVMQTLIDACVIYGETHCLSFNFKKTKTIIFGKNPHNVSPIPLTISGRNIEYVQSWKYLGTIVQSSSSHGLGFSASEDLRKFYRASNAIFSAIGKPHETVSMHLPYSNCVPALTYAAEVKEFSGREMSNINVAINNAIRKIFTFSRRESVRSLRELCGYKSIYDMFAIRKKQFLDRIPLSQNPVLNHLLAISSLINS